jgi:hypothetical protein
MKRLAVSALVFALLAAIAPVAHTDTAKLSLVRVLVTSDAQAEYLLNNFDTSENNSPGQIELVMWPGDRAELDQLGYRYYVVTEDLVARDAALNDVAHPLQHLPGPDYSDYRHLTDYNNEMAELAKKNPSMVKLFEMNQLSLEGRTVYGLEIATDVKRDDGRPIFYVDGVHHAREWPASEFTMMYAHYLLEKFGKDPQITSLLNKARVIIVPIVNVDGFNYSRESVTGVTQGARDATQNLGAVNGFEGYWRKNRRSLTGVTVPAAQANPDAFGVDNNRNYAYLWGDQNGGSANEQYDQTYRGEAPFSEPESANVRDIILGRNVTGIITNHTVQASVLRTGGGLAPDDATLVKIGDVMAKLLGFQNNATVGYPVTGSTDDWAYAAMGSLGFTIEHGGSGFHCAYAECVGTPTDRTMKAFNVMFEVAANPKYHSVLKGQVAGGAAKLTLTKTFKTPLSDGNPLGEKFIVEKLKWSLATDKDGSFEWHVTPSTRPYEKKAESYTLTISQGGKTRTVDVFVKRGQILNLGKV